MGKCKICKKANENISAKLNVCGICIKKYPDSAIFLTGLVHGKIRKQYGLPEKPPRSINGAKCSLCVNECVISKGECGYCGIRKNKNGKLSAEGVLKGNFSFFFDNLPTNCVSYQVCAGCTGAGYPRFSCCPSCELQNKSMGVFLNSCSFNCAFCQNYNFLENIKLTKFQNSKVLVNSIKKDVSCVCFFGGDPSTQLPFTVKVANESLAENKGRILRFCWETNGTMNEKLLDEILGISLKTGGCVKFDIKMFDERLSIALTGITNKRTLSNFARAAKWFEMRKTPPLVTASTLLIPGYIEETEVKNISEFIYNLNPEIPYILLGFYPRFIMSDIKSIDKQLLISCYDTAKKTGLKNVYIADNEVFSECGK